MKNIGGRRYWEELTLESCSIPLAQTSEVVQEVLTELFVL